MKRLECIVILSVWTCVGIAVRVPSSWDEVPRRDSGGSLVGGINVDNRFHVVTHPQEYKDGRLERRAFLENGQASAELGTLYNTLQSGALNDFFGHQHQMLVLNPNGLYMLNQDIQNTAASPIETNQYRHQENPQLQSNNMHFVRSTDHVANLPAPSSENQYQKPYKPLLSSRQNEGLTKYQNLPSNVLRISPATSENIYWNNYYDLIEQSKLKQPVFKRFTPKKYQSSVHKENPRSPTLSYRTQLEVPGQPLKNHASKDIKFIVSASTPSPIDTNPNQPDPLVEFTTKKEPIIFVTEGYRNVLIQGPNNKKMYQKPRYQNQAESKKIFRAEKLGQENDSKDNDDVEKPPRKRKVTKVYKIHGNNPNGDDSEGESSKNLVEEGWKRPRQYFRRPPVYTESDRRAGLRNQLIKNYRDDKTHEPSDDHDQEREDTDNERIKNNGDEDEVAKELEAVDENDADDADANNEDSSKPENDEDDRDNNEDSDIEDDESEDEEEAEKEIPHSEHADPKPVSTIPIYPGEGVWAKQRVKHRPHVSQHTFLRPEEVEQKPDGYDVFEDLEKYFDGQRDKFGRTFGEKIDQSPKPASINIAFNGIPSIKPPNSANPLVVYDPFEESSETSEQQLPSGATASNHHRVAHSDNPESNDGNENDNEENEEVQTDFVPMQLYSQVRKSENEEHEPHDPLEHGRLREVIRDSKVQTVYSEEGYEDAAYDHAGHEKKAEQDQGLEQYEREKLGEVKPRTNKDSDSEAGHSHTVLVSAEPVKDSLPADSIYPSLPTEYTTKNTETSKIETQKPQQLNNKNFITTQEVKTTQVKDKKNGDVQLEIQSEIKVIMQPNNSTKAHKFVKIFPKVLKEFSKEVPEISKGNDQENVLKSSTTTETTEGNDGNNINAEIFSESMDKSVDYEVPDAIMDIEALKQTKGISSTTSSTTIPPSTSTESTTAPKVIFRAFKDEFAKATSTEKPKVIVKILDYNEALPKIGNQFGKIGSQLHRRRRSADGDEKNLDIDIGFIDKINHTFAEKKPDVIDAEKYPYYNRPDLNENSPLRYAENMDYIPVKTEGELSFYKMADRHQCPDLPQNIDPIPEHVKNAHKKQAENNAEDEEDEDVGEETEDEEYNEEDENENEEHSYTPQTPRIQLGDKIDCLKIRYFGENPLDSPFFKEETVGPVMPIFKELDRLSTKIKSHKNIDNAQKTSSIVENINEVNEIFDLKDKKNERKFETELKDVVYNALKETAPKFNREQNTNTKAAKKEENDNAESIRTNVKIIKPIETLQNQLNHPTPVPLVTLITTPKYTIQLTPKNIYDQIRLLDHLPGEEEEDEEAVTEIIETSTQNIKPTTIKTETESVIEVTTEAVQSTAQRRTDQIDGKEESSKREPKVLKEESVAEIKQQEEVKVVTSEAEALRRRRLRPRRPIYQIFDVNTFLTTTPYSIINSVHRTVLPKNKVLSEVFYKDEIKPNEQLNVFADVLNNIKNSTNVAMLPIQSTSNFGEPDGVTINNLEESNIVPEIQTMPNIRVKKYQKDSSNRQNVVNRNPFKKLATTEKYFNARYPESYEEYQVISHSTTNKNVVDVNSDNPDYFGYVVENIRNKKKSYLSEEDNNQHRGPSNTKLNTKKFIRRRRKPMKGTTSTTTSTTFRTTTTINVPEQSSPSNHKPYVRDVLKNVGVVGLVPPRHWLYKTIMDDSEAKGTNEAVDTVYEYKTIPPNFVVEPLTGPAAVTELIDEDPPARPMNTYFFQGLKPPLNQRVRPYSEFLGNKRVTNNNSNSNIRKRMANVGYGHFRYRREASRASYSEVSRNRGRQNEGIQKETTPIDDIDDYVPHRPKNYHYDEKTGKIVYHNKPKEKDIEEEEEEYEEIPDISGIYLETAEDATHPTPKKATTKPLLATATPPPEGKGLLDFVANLKNNPSYQFIPDPTTPHPASKSSTQEIVTVDPKSTNPPEFLNILSKVKSDNSYKFIEDPKETKGKIKSTTPEQEYEEDVEEDEEKEGGASKRRYVRQTDLLIFNIGDYLPKIQTPISSPIPQTPTNFIKKRIVEKFFPKLRYMTPLDIAKEKIHERFQNNTVYQFIRKNIQNSPGGQSQDLSNIQIFDIGEYLPKIKTVSPKTSIDYSKYKTIERPHTRHNMSSRYNSEEQPNLEEVVTVRRPIIMEERESIDRPVVSGERVVHDKETEVRSKEEALSTTQRIVQLRRGTRPTTQKTTAETIEPTELSATRRNSNRRRPIPSGFRTTKRPTTEVTEATEKVERIYPQYSQTERTNPQTHEPAKRVYRKRPVRIRYTTERHEEDEETIDRIVRRSLDSKVGDVRNEFEEVLEEQDDLQDREYIRHDTNEDTAESNIAEKEDTININTKEIDDLNDNLEERKTSESNKQEVVQTRQKEVIIVNENDDTHIKHNANFKSEQKLELPEREVMKEKLGIQGDKAEKDIEMKNESNEKSDGEVAQTKIENEDVEIINPNYDKTKKHGGNYKKEEESGDIEDSQEINDNEKLNAEDVKLVDAKNKKLDVEIVNKNFDQTKKHGGNYKTEEDKASEEALGSNGDIIETQETKNTKNIRSKKFRINSDKFKNSIQSVDGKELNGDNEKDNNNNNRNKRRRPITRLNVGSYPSTTTIPRLTDVVPKPDHFYTDSQLPKEVNTLKIGNSGVLLDSHDLEQVTEEGDTIDIEDLPKRPTSSRRNYNLNGKNSKIYDGDQESNDSKNEDLVDSNDELNSSKNEDFIDNHDKFEGEVIDTEKPLFIKDPSKRLYFYAPL